MAKKLLEHFMKKNCKILIKKNLKIERVIKRNKKKYRKST